MKKLVITGMLAFVGMAPSAQAQYLSTTKDPYAVTKNSFVGELPAGHCYGRVWRTPMPFQYRYDVYFKPTGSPYTQVFKSEMKPTFNMANSTCLSQVRYCGSVKKPFASMETPCKILN